MNINIFVEIARLCARIFQHPHKCKTVPPPMHLQTRITLQTNMSLATNAFCAWDENFQRCRRTRFALENNILALETNALTQRIGASAMHTHTYTSDFQTECMLRATCTYLQNVCYHVEEIQKLCRSTTESLVALNVSSSPSIEETIVEIPHTHRCTRSVVREWPDCTCHAGNK